METDPKNIAEKQEQTTSAPGSFLDMYRSVAPESVSQDESFVDEVVKAGVVPEQVRYGVMRKGVMEVYRGVVKSTTGDLYYFNYGGENFRLLKADNATKEWDAMRMLKSCTLGCDLIKSDDAPLDPGETPDEASEVVSDDGAEKGEGGMAATVPVPQEQMAAQQQRLLTEHHPGGTAAAMPDDNNTGRDWHAAKSQEVHNDGSLASRDGQQHWDSLGLLKAMGDHLYGTLPAAPAENPLHEQFAKSQGLGRVAPRHRHDFARFKVDRLQAAMSPLQQWLDKH